MVFHENFKVIAHNLETIDALQEVLNSHNQLPQFDGHIADYLTELEANFIHERLMEMEANGRVLNYDIEDHSTIEQ